MYMLIKDLQRSVGDRYANKGPSGKILYGPTSDGPPGLRFDGFLFAVLRQIHSLCLCEHRIDSFSSLFPPPKSAL
jgi:hypothetical protein